MLVGYRPDKEGRLDGPGTAGQSPAATEDVVLVPWGDAEATEQVLQTRSDIAAVFVEPVLCNSGVIAPPEGFLKSLRDMCDRTGTVLVFDEVITGFRLAYGGAVERYSVEADLVVLAKAIAGGYPLAAIAGRADLIEQMRTGVVHAGTYNGNPVVLAAAAATLDALEKPGVYDAFEGRGGLLADGMRSSFASHGVACAVNQVGPVVQCSPGIERCDSFEEFLGTDQEFYDRLSVQLLRRGVFTLPGGRWYLSTAHTDQDIAETLTVLDKALAATLAAGPSTANDRR
jgi:glutamate-1-semialdehyde 2,1-aminomutase